MAEFFNVLSPAEALARWLAEVTHRTAMVEAELWAGMASGGVLAEDICSPEDLPAFRRATVDGYAVRAADTYGAGEALPAYLRVVGESHMGEQPAFAVGPGQAALIHTGAMIPAGADAVVMVEHTSPIATDEIEVLRRVAPGENVLQVGEDVHRGEPVLPAGARLRPPEIGALLALGLGTPARPIHLRARPRVAIFSTGDEIVPPGAAPAPGQVRDINSFTISALAAEAGADVEPWGIIPDDPTALEMALRAALAPPAAADLAVITAGSSVSARDMTAAVINRLAAELGGPGVLVHGVAIKPGKPTILAVVDGRPVLGLPGNPVSAVVAFWLFGLPAIGHILGARPPSRPRLRATLTANVPSAAGREDYIPVVLHENDDTIKADPIFGKSNLIFTLVRADGLARIPLDATGLRAGDAVDVYLF
ncbi:MAG: molybdopterin molybdotransferase MoeA [Anaerolineae bacterium]|nr:molybdopterin molybdotransferase MoeA [Anaerolineae bacterium]